MELVLHSTVRFHDMHNRDKFTVKTGKISLAEHGSVTQSCSILILYDSPVGAVLSLILLSMRKLTTHDLCLSQTCCCSFRIHIFEAPFFSSVFGYAAKSEEKRIRNPKNWNPRSPQKHIAIFHSGKIAFVTKFKMVQNGLHSGTPGVNKFRAPCRLYLWVLSI